MNLFISTAILFVLAFMTFADVLVSCFVQVLLIWLLRFIHYYSQDHWRSLTLRVHGRLLNARLAPAWVVRRFPADLVLTSRRVADLVFICFILFRTARSFVRIYTTLAEVLIPFLVLLLFKLLFSFIQYYFKDGVASLTPRICGSLPFTGQIPECVPRRLRTGPGRTKTQYAVLIWLCCYHFISNNNAFPSDMFWQESVLVPDPWKKFLPVDQTLDKFPNTTLLHNSRQTPFFISRTREEMGIFDNNMDVQMERILLPDYASFDSVRSGIAGKSDEAGYYWLGRPEDMRFFCEANGPNGSRAAIVSVLTKQRCAPGTNCLIECYEGSLHLALKIHRTARSQKTSNVDVETHRYLIYAFVSGRFRFETVHGLKLKCRRTTREGRERERSCSLSPSAETDFVPPVCQLPEEHVLPGLEGTERKILVRSVVKDENLTMFLLSLEATPSFIEVDNASAEDEMYLKLDDITRSIVFGPANDTPTAYMTIPLVNLWALFLASFVWILVSWLAVWASTSISWWELRF